MRRSIEKNIYRDLFDSFYKYTRYGYFKDDKNYRDELLNEIMVNKNKIESKYIELRNYNEDYSLLFLFLTNHIISFHEFLLFAYENILLSAPRFKLKKDDESSSLEFNIGDNKYLINTGKTKIKNPNPGNIALSMIYENKNSDTLDKKDIKVINIDSKYVLIEFSLYTPFIIGNITEDERMQLEVIVENVISYIKDEMDKILNHILHLYTNNNLDWKVVIDHGLWIRNSEPKKRYFKRSTHS